MKIDLQYVDASPSKGRIYYYFRHKGKREPLPGAPGTREFQERYDELLAARTPHVAAKLRRTQGGAVGTLGYIIVKYTSADNPIWTSCAPSTQAVYRRYFDWLREHYGDFLMAAFEKQDIKQIRNKLRAEPVKANAMVNRFGQLWNWADEHLDPPLTGAAKLGAINPTTGVKALEHQAESAQTWPAELCDKFEAYENRSWATMFMLLRYTGQRASDCAKMQWADYSEARQAIYVVQQKTGKKLWVPCHKRLQEWLAATERTGDFIVISRVAKKFDPTSVSSHISKIVKLLGFPGYSAHGLRHLAGAELAEAGCNNRMIMAILGHASERQASRYQAQANERRLASGAMAAWEALEPLPEGDGKVVRLPRRTA